jgi:copper resistance protein C
MNRDKTSLGAASADTRDKIVSDRSRISRAMRDRRVLLLIALLPALYFAPVADAHAIVMSSSPAAGAAVSGPDLPVRLHFNSRIDAKRSRLILVGPDGQQQALSIDAGPSGDLLVSEAKGLKTGSYLLRWQVLASDGHITRGEVPFRVK